MKCCKCGKELPDHARFCKYCGAEQAVVTESAEPAKKKKRWPMIAALILVLIAGGIGGYVYFSGKEYPELVHDIFIKISGNKTPSAAKVSEANYSPNGSLQSSAVYKYSDDGLKAECARWEKNPVTPDEQYRRTTYYELTKPYDLSAIKYTKNCDESGKMTSETVYEDDGKKVTYKSYGDSTLIETVYIYDNNKNPVLIQTFQNGELIEEITEKWSRDGKLLSKERNGEPEAIQDQQIFRKYDNRGNVTALCNIINFPENKETGTPSEKLILTTYSDYDSNGNKTKAVTYQNGILGNVLIIMYMDINDLNEEVMIPEKIVVEENKTDDYSLFTEEIKKANSE